MKLLTLQQELNRKLVERQEAIQGILLALIAREHVLMLGPAGVAKSALAVALAQAISGSYFHILLTKFTTPEEVFGPISIKSLEEDKYERNVVGYLATSQVAFLDEVYKASSAILNALLTILNERSFRNGTRSLLSPLETCIAASNELPQDASLGALHDRFLLRYVVSPVSDQGAPALWALDREPLRTRVSPEELKSLQAQADQVGVSQDILQAAIAIRQDLTQAGVYISDRRFVQIRKLVQASAALGGRAQAEGGDLHAAAPALWNTPDQIERAKAIVTRHAGAVPSSAPAPLPPEVTAWLSELADLHRRVTQSRERSPAISQRVQAAAGALRPWADHPQVKPHYERFRIEVVLPLIGPV